MERRASFFFIYLGTVVGLSIAGFFVMVVLGQPDEVKPGVVIPPRPTVAVYRVAAEGPELWSVERPVAPGMRLTLSVFPAGRERVAVVARDGHGRAEILYDERPRLRQQALMLPVAWTVPPLPEPAVLVVVVGAEPLAPSDAEAALAGRARGAGVWVDTLRFERGPAE
ncbi:MAG: hypothetical protein EP329_28040 [Deltaproteobacteria bacterium]|nr:MAG: hypothetical protein EP329_28040 [Deltaproteobacteria bacterium]